MTPSQMIPVTVAEHQALARRVEKLERLMRRQSPVSPSKTVSKVPPKRKKDVRVLIQEMQEKYAGTTSLTQSLLAERRAEIAREEAEIRTRLARRRRAGGQGKGIRTGRGTTRRGAKQ